VTETLIDPPCGECGHTKSRHSERDEPHIPNPAECEDCTGPGQPWRHEFLPVEDAEDGGECQAAEYASLADTYNGSSLCGCSNCIEYVADRESEDEV